MEVLIGCYLMQTDVKYLAKPIRIANEPSLSLTYCLGKPLIKIVEETREIFEFTEEIQYYDFVYCVCGMLI